MNVIEILQRYNAGRDPERLQMKYRRMRVSALAFLRGSCHLYWQRVPRSGSARSAPLAWCCGDLHLENFGSYRGENGQLYFDINDFDEAALAPASWELLRLLCSVRLALREAGGRLQPHSDDLVKHLMQSYADTLATGRLGWVEPSSASGPVGELLEGLGRRSWRDFLASRSERKGRQRRLRLDGRKALPASPAERIRVETLLADFAARQPEPDFWRVQDVGRRIAGTGSLGLERYVVLVHGRGGANGQRLLDLKRAQPSALQVRAGAPEPGWASQAARIVTLQQRVQAMPIEHLHALPDDAPAQPAGRARQHHASQSPVPPSHVPQGFVLRSLQPSQDRIELNHELDERDWFDLLQTQARLLAWAQLRASGRQGAANADALIDFARRHKWRQRLAATSIELAEQTLRDAEQFNAAYDDGVFRA